MSYRGSSGGGRGGGRGGRGSARGSLLANDIFSHGNAAQAPPPNKAVHDAENATLKQAQTELSLSSLNLNGARMPLRPGYGTQGTAVLLWANYMAINRNDKTMNVVFYRYKIDIHPDKDGKVPKGRKAAQIIRLALEQEYGAFVAQIATDYKSLFFSTKSLTLGPQPFQVQYRSEYESQPRSIAPNYRVRIEENGNFSVATLMQHLMSTNQKDALAEQGDIIQALNIIMGHFPKTDPQILSLSANKHFPIEDHAEQSRLAAGLTAIRGYIISVRPATSRLLLNIQVKNAAIYGEISLADLIKEFGPANSFNRFRLNAFLAKLRVRVTHPPSGRQSSTVGGSAATSQSRIKTIYGLADPRDGMGRNTPRPRVPAFGAGSAAVEFYENSSPTGQGAYISVAAFFKRQYSYTNLDTALPVVNVGSRQKPVYLPAEICDVIRGQPCMAKLSAEQTSQMINFSVRRPARNATSIITKGVETIRLPNDTLRYFNLAVNPQLITVPGRILNPPNVVYNNKENANTRNGGWNMAQIQFNNGATLPPWTYLMLSLPWKRKTDAFSSPVQAEATLSRFHNSLRLNGLTGPAAFRSNPGRLQLQNDDGDYGRLDKAFDQILSTPQKPRLILIILTDSDSIVYKHLKLLGDVRKGVHVICVVGSKLANQAQRDPENLQYFANVALKFNIRLGGINQILPPTKLGILDEGKTMAVGIDVTHPSPGSSDDAPSVAAIVASVDKNLVQFLADIQINPSRKEPVENLVSMMKSRLQLWQRKNGNLPENIIVYRDGVSEGQYNIVLDQELPKLREACKVLYPANSLQPKMTIIIVGKRHHTRFYPTKAADTDERSANTKNGTVVDRGVTEARLWDFFLQAHSSGLGTARPAHYVVILDEVFRQKKALGRFATAADALEDLTHNMCYMHARATKAVSICPPAYYADLVCERARCYLSSLFDPSVQGTPAASVASGQQGGVPASATNNLRIHPNLRDSMFYI